jgi:hypothetical protein
MLYIWINIRQWKKPKMYFSDNSSALLPRNFILQAAILTTLSQPTKELHENILIWMAVSHIRCNRNIYIKYVFCVHAMKLCNGSRGVAPLILNLGTRWRWVVNFTPQPLYPWERTSWPIKYKAGWGPELVWTFGEGKIQMCGNSPKRFNVLTERWLLSLDTAWQNYGLAREVHPAPRS